MCTLSTLCTAVLSSVTNYLRYQISILILRSVSKSMTHTVESARIMIEANANVNHRNAKHVTALNMACENEHDECALLLLHAGTRADVKDDWGDTPLSIAQRKGMSN